MVDLLAFSTVFPERGPYRVDQVRNDPAGLILLFLLEIGLACLIAWLAGRGSWRAWRVAAAALVGVVGLFFTLASWGLGDVTRLSYLLVERADTFGLREPLWSLLAPVVRFLPYRFSFVHGAVAAGYAGAVIWLARRLRSPAWAGWWALMVVHSPLLRNFLQSGVTRQALAAILLMPIMLVCAGGLRLSTLRASLLGLLAALSHSSFLLSLLVAVAPLGLGRPPTLAPRPGSAGSWRRRFSGRGLALLALLGLTSLAWLLANSGHMLTKMSDYLWNQDYYPRSILRPEVDQFLLALTLAVVLGCWMQRIGPARFLEARPARALILFFALLALLRLSIEMAWLPQLTSRFQDTAGLYLMIVFLTWIASRSLQRLTVIPIAVSLQYWLFDRLAFAGLLACGRNDEFLCVPDRLPWHIVYWR